MSRRGRVGGSGGNARVRQREDDTVPIPPQIDVAGSWRTWGKLSVRGGEGKHLVNDIMSDSFQKYKFCGSTRELSEVYEHVAVNPRIHHYIGLTNWGYMVSAQLARTDHMLVYALLERWWPSTHTFHLPMMELGFTPYDFTCITGVTVGLGQPVPFQTWDQGTAETKGAQKLALFEELFPTIPEEEYGDYLVRQYRGLKASGLKRFIMDQDVPDVEDSDHLTLAETCLLRAFFLYAISQVWFPNNAYCVSFGWLEAVRDVTRVSQYDWGSAILAGLYQSLDECSTLGNFSVQCCWTALQYWFWEVFGSPAPVLRDPEIIVYPAVLRWSQERIVRGGLESAQFTEHSIDAVRRRLETATFENIHANPWDGEVEFQNADVQRSYGMSLLRTVWAGQHFAWYLGERLWHQLSGGEQNFGIPYPPPSQLLTSREHFWAWRQDLLIPRNGETLRMACQPSLWLEYWTHVSVGPTLPQVYKYRNVVGENPMVGRQLGLVASEYPGADTGSGALAYTQLPPLLPQYYSPHSLSLPGYPEPVTFERPPYPLPDYQSAAPEAWYDFAVHEKSCVGGRDLYIAEERRRFQKEQRRAEKGQRRAGRRQTYIDSLSAQFGHLMQDYPQPADSSSSSSDHSAAAAYEDGGPSHQYQTQDLGDDY